MMSRAWLLKRVVYLGVLVAMSMSAAVVLLHDWNRVVGLLNGSWPQWVTNVANVLQIARPGAALACWLSRAARSRSPAQSEGGWVRVLRCLAWTLPSRDRERFVREVMANMADRQRWWQRLQELLSVAAGLPGLAVILRWARRRRA